MSIAESLARTVVRIPELVAKKQLGMRLGGAPARAVVAEESAVAADSSTKMKVSVVFRSVFKALCKSKLWQLGAELKSLTGKPLQPGFRNFSGKLLNKGVLVWPGLGRERMRQNALRRLSDDFTGNTTNMFAHAPALAADNATVYANLNLKAAATDAGLLPSTVITVEEICAEVRMHAANDYYAIPCPRPSKTPREWWLGELCRARRAAVANGNPPEPIPTPVSETTMPPTPLACDPLICANPVLRRALRVFDPTFVSSREEEEGRMEEEEAKEAGGVEADADAPGEFQGRFADL